MSERIIKIQGGDVYTPSGVKSCANVIVKGNRIEEITTSPIEIEGAQIIDATGMKVVPGGIEMHVHGGGGRDYMEGDVEAFRVAIDAHMQHGTTAVYGTLSSSSVPMIQAAAKAAEVLMAEEDSALMGLHLEGPYFNPKKAGAQIPEFITPPIKEDYEMILDSTKTIKRWDAAPELPGTVEFGKCLVKHGVLPTIAHCAAEYPDVKAAFDAGFTHATHFYNAMTGFHNVREYKHEGTIESVYAIPEMTVEMICDGIHVPPTILRMIYLLKGVEKTALITDALACSASDSAVAFDPRVIIEDGVCKLADRSALAGSIATMDRLIKTAVTKADIPFADAVRMSSETPAGIMGISGRKGTLVSGKDADITMYDASLDLKFVMQMGRIVRNDL